eukprot:CAMPEP_0169163406 /NCGR_PEP_ID=MMETSP1015-20121227/58250_1 /TAXON_ID=342587 /ORGANISM="Karlodinium micrum, Strain CCMP2283" /LENGTH=88 /DNA_ID=CAMNT_0009235705 /DNA_START=1 /DNA_END=264 /DNA_ORIENTATION=+
MLIVFANMYVCTSAVIASKGSFANITYVEPLGIYEEHLRVFGLQDTRANEDSVAWSERQALFRARYEEVQKHNAQQGNLWVATLNHFA